MESKNKKAKNKLSEAAADEHMPSRIQFYSNYVLGALVALIIGWGLASVYLTKIAVGNFNVAAHTADIVLTTDLQHNAASYKLAIQYPDGHSKSYALSDIGLALDAKTSLKATRQLQHRLVHRLEWWQPVPALLNFKLDHAAFNNFVASAASQTVQPPQDAALSIVNGQITIDDAVTGKQYGLAEPQTTLMAAATSLQKAPVKLSKLSVRPALTAKILEPYKAELTKALNQPVSFTIGSTTVQPTPAQIAGWLEITPDDKIKKVDITVNSGKVQQYINKIAAASIHPPRAEVDVNQSDGTTQVLIPGVNGTDITNKNGVATAIASALLKGGGINQDLQVSYKPFQTITAGDYDKWIEVDLTNKRLYAYEKTNLVNTYLVSAGAPATPTVTGQYNIYAKFAEQDMRGNNVDGSRYFQPHVQWINYFYGDYAIHGNYWRPLSYFGNINSSHGCVGLVNGEAEWIYNWAPIGTPVIVHT